MLPNAVIAGAPKAGTTSIHRWMNDHPEVLCPTVKETGYFVDRDSHAFNPAANFCNQGLVGYERYFSAPDDSAPTTVLEVAPDYMYQETAIRHLPTIPTRPLIVFILREPAAQIYSLFNYLKHNWQYVPRGMSFAQFVELARDRSPRLGNHELLQNALGNCRYAAVLDRWRVNCDAERLRVYLFEDLIADNKAFVQRLSREFGIDAGFYDHYEFPRENATYRVRSTMLQSLNVALRKKLPKGRLYESLRALYRRTNTGAAAQSDDDRRVIRTLREEFASDNRSLEARYGIDLAAWDA